MHSPPCAVSLWRSNGWTEKQQGLGTLSHVCMMLGVTSLHQSCEPVSSLQKLLLVKCVVAIKPGETKGTVLQGICPVTRRSVSPCSMLEAAMHTSALQDALRGERC